MAFNFLQNRINKSLKNVSKRAVLNDENIAEVLDDIKLVLLEADVNLKVAQDFVDSIKQKAKGQTVGEFNTSSQLVLKIINEELIDLLGHTTKEWKVQKPDTVMFVGLQGSGKTTSVAKLANYLANSKKYYSKPLLVGLDTYRPAAIDQLETLAKTLNYGFYSDKVSMDPIKIVTAAMDIARREDYDLIILDTAGRLQTDEKLMNELKEIKSIARPSEVIQVVDAMSGQEIINVASQFNDAVKLTGIIISKLDSDAKGGSALSIRSLLNVPIMFVGTGEKIENIELFHPDRMASRILGLGDIKTLTEKAADISDESKNERMFRKMLAGTFDLEDLLDSFKAMKKMGNMEEIMKMMPGVNVADDQMAFIEKRIKAYQAIVDSMTKKERRNLKVLGHPKRKDRILKGSGRTIQEYNELIRRFEKSQKQIKELVKQIKSGRMPNLKGGFGA